MIQSVTPELYETYDSFVDTHPRGHFLQSRQWGAHKAEWQWAGLICRDETGRIRGTLGLLYRPIPMTGYCLMYGGRGPVCDPDDVATVTELLEGAKALAREKKCYCIKLDPDIPATDRAFDGLMGENGYVLANAGKNFEAIQPRYVFRLPLQGRDEETLFGSFESKTRYNIRLAGRRGVEVQVAGKEAVPAFAALMRETGKRDGFLVRGEGYFRSLLDNLGENARLYLATFQGQPIAGAIAIHWGEKVWYLYGASANCHREKMPNYLLQWEMIRWAVECGCQVYDFRGVSGDLSPENPLYGLYRFKKSFNGELTEFLGEYELVLKPRIQRRVRRLMQLRHLYGKVRYRVLRQKQADS